MYKETLGTVAEAKKVNPVVIGCFLLEEQDVVLQ